MYVYSFMWLSEVSDEEYGSSDLQEFVSHHTWVLGTRLSS